MATEAGAGVWQYIIGGVVAVVSGIVGWMFRRTVSLPERVAAIEKDQAELKAEVRQITTNCAARREKSAQSEAATEYMARRLDEFYTAIQDMQRDIKELLRNGKSGHNN